VQDWPEGVPPSVGSTVLKGGMICVTTLERLADGRDVVVKRCPYPAEVEAEGLRALAAADGPVPAVIGCAANVLVLEYIDGPPGTRPRAGQGAPRHVGPVRLAPGQPGRRVRPAEHLV
jgi:hypothetical protein